jgi:hypothetical protein
METINKYRIIHGTIYEYMVDQDAYVCIGKTIQFEKFELDAMRKQKISIDNN